MWPFGGKELSAIEEQSIKDILSLIVVLKAKRTEWKKHHPIQYETEMFVQHSLGMAFNPELPKLEQINKMFGDIRKLSMEVCSNFTILFNSAIKTIKKKSGEKLKSKLGEISEKLKITLNNAVGQIGTNAKYQSLPPIIQEELKKSRAATIKKQLRVQREAAREYREAVEEEPTDEDYRQMLENARNVNESFRREIKKALATKKELEGTIAKYDAIIGKI